MTDILLPLVPTYGLWLILSAVALSCLALPVPASLLVMAGGGFAAAGDLILWQVTLCALLGMALGDQLAYWIARRAGTSLTERAKKQSKLAASVTRAEAMFENRGATGVFLSRTIFSPIGPYMSYLSGALGLGWATFTTAALLGGIIWAVGYASLGFIFADQIVHLSSMIGNFFGIILAGAGVILLGRQLRKAYLAQKDKGDL